MGDSRVPQTHGTDPELLRHKEDSKLVRRAAVPAGAEGAVMRMLGACSLAPLVAVPSGQGLLNEAEVSERLEMREGRRVCRRCDSVVLLDQVQEEDESEVAEEEVEEAVCTGTGAAGHNAEDEYDGECQAKVVKVVIKCQCHERLSFLKRHRQSFILNDTEIMSVYRDYQDKLGTRETEPEDGNGLERLLGCMRATSVPEDIAEHHLQTVKVTITNPVEGAAPSPVEIGLVVTTLRDEEGYLRHFVQAVTPGSPADNMELKNDDELLLLNDSLLVNTSPDEMEAFFSAVNIDQEFSLLTRRVIEKSGGIRELFSRSGTDYEYWKIRATVTVDQFEEPILAEKAHFTKAHLTNGDLLIMKEAHVLPMYISSETGYLKVTNNRITSDENIREEDPSFRFDMLTYSAILQTSTGLQQRNARMIRHWQDGGAPSFLYVNDAGNIKLKKCPPELQPEPSVDEVNVTHCYRKFCIHNALFLAHDATDAGQKYYLESYAKQQRFLQYNPDVGHLTLHRVPRIDYLPYQDHVTFELQPLNSTDNT